MINSVPPICKKDGCTNPARKNKTEKRYLKYCSLECQYIGGSAAGSEQRKQTCIERFGFTSNLKSPESKQKRVETCQERYGSSHFMKTNSGKSKVRNTKQLIYNDPSFNNREKYQQTMERKTSEQLEEIQNKRTTTNIEKYGVKSPIQNFDILQQMKSTNIERYGFENVSQNIDVKKRISNTMLSKYGCHFQQQHISENTLNLLQDKEWLLENASKSYAELAETLDVTYHTVARAFEINNIEHVPEPYFRSVGEQQLLDWAQSQNFETVANTRNILPRQELDIYIPSKQIAIEYNGLYWHSELSGKSKDYHQKKFEQCQQQNIKLIQITDWHWLNKNELVKSRLLSKLGIIENKIGARSCVIQNVDNKTASLFLDETHIQGSCMSKVKLGLYFENNLVALMTFGSARFKQKPMWELIRYSTLKNFSVVGGASKLFSYFIKNYNPESITSFCDLSWNSGNLYQQLGFTWQRNTNSNYWYTCQYKTFENRIKYQKHKLSSLLIKFDPTLSEWENMKLNGYDRYWDCGNSVWQWNK
jgi:hypothetical protein